MMKIKASPLRVGTILLTFATYVAAVAGASSAQYLRRIPLDNHATLGTTVATDTLFRTKGGASIRVRTRWPTVVNIGEETRIPVDGVLLVFQAKLMARALDGTAYLEMWCHFADGSRYFARGVDSTVSGSADWTPVQTVFRLEPGQRPVRVTLNLVVNGTGTVWIDEARLRARSLR